MSTLAVEKRNSVYFGYGSNLWQAAQLQNVIESLMRYYRIDQMKKRCPESKYIGVGILREWKWIINARGYANVVKDPEAVVYGLLFEINQGDESRLDVYEGVPDCYIKETLDVEILPDGKLTKALVYIDIERTEAYLKPKKEYISRMNMAIRDALKEGVSERYIKEYLRPYIPEAE